MKEWFCIMLVLNSIKEKLMDKLERLTELDQEELQNISEKIKQLRA